MIPIEAPAGYYEPPATVDPYWEWVKSSQAPEVRQEVANVLAEQVVNAIYDETKGTISGETETRLARLLAGLLGDLPDDDQAIVARFAAHWGHVPDYLTVEEARDQRLLERAGL